MRVLVIDDEPDVLLLCRVNLEFEGFDVLEASDGERGGASDYITKPFSPGVLIDAVAKVASMSREELRARRAETLSRLSFLNRL